MTPPKVNQKTPGIIFRKEGWLEHLEREVDPNLREDLELLLKNSTADRKEFSQLKATRELVKKSDDVLLPESGIYFENLHDKIMAAIEEEPLKRVNVMSSRFTNRFKWGTFAGAASMTMMIALVSWISLKTVSVEDVRTAAALEQSANQSGVEMSENFDRDLAAVSGPETDVSVELNGYESEAEFVTAAVEERLKNLSPDQADALFASLER